MTWMEPSSIPSPLRSLGGKRSSFGEPTAGRTAWQHDARELATEAAELLIGRGRSARAVVVRGDPAEGILEIAESESADLIVMGRRGLGRLRGVLVGSVSERVSRHAECPVLLAN